MATSLEHLESIVKQASELRELVRNNPSPEFERDLGDEIARIDSEVDDILELAKDYHDGGCFKKAREQQLREKHRKQK
jgi:hypothetical protein